MSEPLKTLTERLRTYAYRLGEDLDDETEAEWIARYEGRMRPLHVVSDEPHDPHLGSDEPAEPHRAA